MPTLTAGHFGRLTFVAVVSAIAVQALAQAPGVEIKQQGQTVYQQRCAVCHDYPRERIPSKKILAGKSHDHIVAVLTKGLMQMQAAGLSATQIDAVAAYLSTAADTLDEEPQLRANLCKQPAMPLRPRTRDWNGWSPDLQNTRMQMQPGLAPAEVPRLKPKWVFAYPGSSAYGPPSEIGARVFVGTANGSVVSLDAKTGCTYWATDPGAAVKTAISVGSLPQGRNGSRAHYAAYFGDSLAFVHAVDAETGAPLWTTKIDEHPFAAVGESPKLYRGRLYVPIRSIESQMGNRDDYSCCTLRGGYAVLDAVTGALLSRAYTIVEQPRPFQVNRAGTQMYGPAGAGIWSPLTIDPTTSSIYGGTAESRTDVSTDGADAIVAFDLQSGARRWAMQATRDDNFTWYCESSPPGANCPKVMGPDADFASPPILRTLPAGKRVLVDAQKSGVVHALDPDAAGKIIWRRDLSEDAHIPPGVVLRDHDLHGVVFGMAADAHKVYVAIADPETTPGHVPLGLYALDLATGKTVWHTPGAPVPSCSWGKEGCTGAQRTAVTLIPGVAFAGSSNGHVRGYATGDGRVIWDFDTATTYNAVNGVKAHGGAVEGAATVVADGTVYVMSGYGSYGGGMGKVLIAFTVDGK
jgi:polyvinyl alcohol dehydrogenase (cytochrome)